MVVPVFLGPGEGTGEILTSNAYSTLAKILGGLRAHDAETIEALADPRVRSGRSQRPGGEAETVGGEEQEQARADEDAGEAWVSQSAAGLLRFSEPRDAALLAQFVQLRVIDPENTYRRRGIAAASRWLRETGSDQLRVPYDYVTPQDRAGAFPLGVWLADQRKYYNSAMLEAARVQQLEALGMVWSHHDVAFEEGLAAARAWAAAHDGMLLPPANAVGEGGFPIGIWAKNMRAAARRTLQNAERRAAGERVSSTGELAPSRMEALEAIDPGWCPLGWDIAWQRRFRLARVAAGGPLPAAAGEVIVQGEDLGAWVHAPRLDWDDLLPAQQWLLESTLGLEPAAPEERPVKRTQDDKWALNIAAARQFHAREGHLTVPRKHVEDVDGTPVGLGSFISNTRRRAGKLSTERRADLSQLGMRW
ncbi:MULTISPECIES: helicase associated domain-containing protein [unclassified Streptomyces]|uniref:helicase associated domain-containing protein n=1 Tax=unclassified Streptomyces TaxID=2593676 RepID=UPI002E805F2B|nr:helicase associated domain-containing protein [Streptomyces sp. NBC_00589]WTI33521.1 helicase associated domain-containing protein [Streptomyces sp. NBC_00775]WTI42406.1 helicase associated domain-containing protein [Streptomyces sp. NBC_00775]WUB23912.1 helicase associated domain-containing protein [Streptomyces sp. NBC_00589]